MSLPEVHDPSTSTTVELDESEARKRYGHEERVEVVMHELGESLAASLAGIQDELARYSASSGRHVVDELSLSIPVDVRVDPLGQLVVTAREPGQAGGKITLRLRPDDVPTRPLLAPVDLAKLGSLMAGDVEVLNEYRIFSVEDLLRVGRNPSGRHALRKIALADTLDAVLDEADLLTLPTVPRRVLELMTSLGIHSSAEFVAADAEVVAAALTKQLGQEISPEEISSWQQEVEELGGIRLPKLHPPPLDPVDTRGEPTVRSR
ncbi:MAG TPA: hypothetical protein VG318_05060 [Actinomycetota bacterium]|nr:hypothetical protein [Actinomycetota bacterium]